MMRGMPTILWLVKIFLALGRLPPLVSYVLHMRNEAGGFNGKPEQFFLEPTIVGKRYALCVGIDDYPEPNTLSGCVGDANDWEAFFRTQGFAVTKLTDGDATLKAILEGMRDVTQNAVAGDIVAIQYSGHGTTVPDSSGDEPDGNDEALVPFDFDSSGFLIDDDIGAVFDEAPNGVALNIFFDCCHSGTATRLLVTKKKMRALGEKARYLAATPEMIEVHQRAIQKRRVAARKDRKSRGIELAVNPAMREVLFAACQPSELALESNGNGAFTRAALKVLKSGVSGHTNAMIVQEIIAEMGTSRSQTPQLSCPPNLQTAPFFGSISSATRDERNETIAKPFPGNSPQTLTFNDLPAILDSLSKSIRALAEK